VKIARLLVKAFAALLAVAALGIAGLLAYYLVFLPQNVPAPNITVERTPQRVARGEYLATAVFGCMYCHSERDWSKFAGPVKPGTLGQGGQVFDQRQGLSGKIVSPNLTPYHLGSWTDGEIYRAITSGLTRDGHAMFPLMPWDAYIWLRTEDVYAIIAYLRSLAPIEAEWEPRKPSLLMRIIANSRVRSAEPWQVDESDPVSRGEYIAVVGGCRFCHTTRAPRSLKSLSQENYMGFWGGGAVIPGHGTPPLPASNISPDKATGIGNWTVEQFIARFKAYDGAQIPVGPNDPNTEHAWTEYARMTDRDLADVYAYLMAQRPRHNAVR
jgi:mono/diheme cytochrome c family protein